MQSAKFAAVNDPLLLNAFTPPSSPEGDGGVFSARRAAESKAYASSTNNSYASIWAPSTHKPNCLLARIGLRDGVTAVDIPKERQRTRHDKTYWLSNSSW